LESAGERVLEIEWNICFLADLGLGALAEAGMRVDVEDMAGVEGRGERPKRSVELDVEMATMGLVRMDGGVKSLNAVG
jgi:hypothetical protein